MLRTLKLILPALIPSWRFFDAIAPSPRIEFALLKSMQHAADNWQEFRPRPINLSIITMLKRMFWNPIWNESLFLVSCAERIIKNPTEHSIQEILKRIKNELCKNKSNIILTPYLQYRLVFIVRNNKKLQKHVVFTSVIYSFL